jgi:hypothetical protein
MMEWIPLHSYLVFQVVYLNVVAFPLWVAGLLYLLLAPAMKPYRLFGVTFLAVLGLLVAVGSKPYYPAPAYAVLFAAGAVGTERFIARRGLHWLRPAGIAVLSCFSLVLLPYSLPILPIERFLAYSRVVYLQAAFTFETGRILKVPQYYADMFGWENQVDVVGRVYASLTGPEQEKTIIYADNYGEAGAVNLFGRKHGLPPAISDHFNYYYWGPGPEDTEVVIAFGNLEEEDLRKAFHDVKLAATITHPYAIFYENDIPVYVCRRLRAPMKKLWAEMNPF